MADETRDPARCQFCSPDNSIAEAWGQLAPGMIGAIERLIPEGPRREFMKRVARDAFYAGALALFGMAVYHPDMQLEDDEAGTKLLDRLQRELQDYQVEIGARSLADLMSPAALARMKVEGHA